MHSLLNKQVFLRLALPLALLLGIQPVSAGPTALSTVPLNVSSSNEVKPNLMLLYDNSGSMNYNYTPDYIGVNTTCRAGATMAGTTPRSCVAGDAPFNSADFNRQYYDPKVRFMPPVYANGTSYADMNRAQTSNWTRVPNDAYNINNNELRTKDETGRDLNTTSTHINLTTEFPDIAWCAGSSTTDCLVNTSSYAFPDNSRKKVKHVEGAPYYYTINVAEYCTDSTLRNCTTTAVNGDAPAGYPVPAKVRFCDTTALTNCQGKYVGNFKYPRFSGENRSDPWWGTITIGATTGTTSVTINSVSALGQSNQIITNAAVVAANGTNTEDKRSIMASALAASIIARTGLADQFTACVTTPRQAGVPACSSFGISLGGTNMVAVLPVECLKGASKAAGTCTPVTDNSRAGDSFLVNTGTGATALLGVAGTTHTSRDQVLGSLKLGATELLPSGLTFGRNVSASNVVTALVRAIGTRGSITAYAGGSSASTLCRSQAASTLCLVDTAAGVNGNTITVGSLSNNTQNNATRLLFTIAPAATDGVPYAMTATSASIFVRTNIVPARTAYPRDPARTDCAGAVCTYDEEMTNLANWYAYYKTRNQMMKTAVGHAFKPVTDKYKVGVVALSVASANNGPISIPRTFSGADRANWYASLYGMITDGSTPVRAALHAIGKMYANTHTNIQPRGEEAVTAACQQNFTFITTDGYWNGTATSDVGNLDVIADAARFCTQDSGCVDARAQSVPSLADIALYWYNGGSNDIGKSLRPTKEDMNKPGIVPAGPGENKRLHMKTYALGLGVDGIMTYEPNYDGQRNPVGDLQKVIDGVATGCPWNNNGRWIWPDPESQKDGGSLALQSRVDDLWHAAINGHGKYFSASDPNQVIEGFRAALAKIETQVSASSSLSISSPTITASDKDVFAANYTTVKWSGRLSKREIDVNTGAILPTEFWNTSSLLGAMVGADTDERDILMLDVDNKVLKPFLFASMTPAEQSWFANKCSALAQCLNMTDPNRAIVNNGATMVNWLRGQQQHANDTLLRSYSLADPSDAGPNGALPVVLGDIASSTPVYMRDSRKNFDRDGYAAFRQRNATRAATVFVGANDGMLHAFSAASGAELWAYAPRITMKKLHLQASIGYNTEHQYTVDGTPEIGEVFYDNSWKSVLVGGLNAGGRGYYAIDVTDPAAPKALWELCADPAVCSGTSLEGEIGLTFGNPQFGTIVYNNVETWVVFLTSGYNNVPDNNGVSTGGGKGWLFVVDVKTGRVLYRLSTGAGDTTTPSGLAKITAITLDPRNDPRVTYVYGGDNSGKMWRFDFTGSQPSVLMMGDAGATQPITTRPEVTICRANKIVDGVETAGTARVVVFGSGRLLHPDDVPSTALQSIYILKDSGQTIADVRATPDMLKKTLSRKTANDPASPFIMTGVSVDLARQKGWYVDLSLNSGERVNIDPKVFSGTLAVVTSLPSAKTECSVGGTGNLYQFNVCAATAVTTDGEVGEPIIDKPPIDIEIVNNDGGFDGHIRGPDGEEKVDLKPSESDGARRTGWRRVRD